MSAAVIGIQMSLFNIFGSKIKKILGCKTLDDPFWTGLEETLIEADVGVKLTNRFIDSARRAKDAQGVKDVLAGEMVKVLAPGYLNACAPAVSKGPFVVLVLGVNGVGKTTTIAKLAHNYKSQGKKVLLVAADTFRAAAVEQLKEWGSRLEIEVVSQNTGADAAAVAFDGVQKAVAKNYDIVLIDTAGRLHTKQNLMDELKKISRVLGKAMQGAPHEKLLVLDATVGSNGLTQTRLFHEAIGLTGVIVTKLDGTAKGGIVFAVAGELKIPITHIGIGEKMNDLKLFESKEFVKSILG